MPTGKGGSGGVHFLYPGNYKNRGIKLLFLSDVSVSQLEIR